MHIKSKNDNILNTTSKLEWNQQNQKKNKQNIDMEDIKGEVCLLGNLISPKF